MQLIPTYYYTAEDYEPNTYLSMAFPALGYIIDWEEDFKLHPSLPFNRLTEDVECGEFVRVRR